MYTNKKKYKLIDTFLFFNEFEMLRTRLEYLGPIVDYFVISEANVDFAGLTKPTYLNDKFVKSLPFAQKIITNKKIINLNNLYWILKRIRYRKKLSRFLWKLQDAQRNSLLTPLKKFNENDLIIFSDLDEFPSINSINFFQDLFQRSENITDENFFYSCKQIFFYYDLKHCAIDDEFYGSIFTNLKSFRKYLPHKIKSNKNNIKHIENGGWHFSYFMNEDKIKEKILAISDVENLSHYKSLTANEIKEKIINNVDLYGRNIKFDTSGIALVPQELVKLLAKNLPNCV